MRKFKSGLFLALVLAITTTSVFADGQVPIVGRSVSETNKSTAPIINTATETGNEVSSELSDYLWTLAGIIGQIKF